MNAPDVSTLKLTFIGAGNMTEALVKGILASKVCSPGNICVTDVDQERCSHFETTYAVKSETDNKQAVQDVDVVVLAVKPQVMNAVLSELAGLLKENVLVISIAAGLRAETLEKALGEPVRVVRVMPNTPALVGRGASAIAAGTHATHEDLDIAEALLSAAGVVVRLDESAMDAVTAVSGSGPAYVFYLAEAMLEGARREGLDEAAARKLVAMTIEGAGTMLRVSTLDPETLRARVTSKGGTTAAAIGKLEEQQVKEAVVAAIEAARRRSEELSGS